jgi:hypothetical protein
VSSVVDPVGPLPKAVYWRRRLIVLVVALLALFLLLRACGGADGAPVSDPSGTDPATTDQASDAPGTSTPSPSPSPMERPTTAATTTAAVATGACADDAIAVTATVAEEQYPVGGPVPIRFVVRSTAEQPCTRDVGAAANTVTIRSEGRRIWVSDDCTPGGDPDVRTLRQGEAFAVTVTWQGDVSRPGCESPRPKAPAGAYEVLGRNGDVTGPPDRFTLG